MAPLGGDHHRHVQTFPATGLLFNFGPFCPKVRVHKHQNLHNFFEMTPSTFLGRDLV